MKRTLLFFAFFLIAFIVSAQEIKVKLMEYLPNDLAARTHPRPDVNGVNCALIRVVVPAVKDMKFDGWVVGDLPISQVSIKYMFLKEPKRLSSVMRITNQVRSCLTCLFRVSVFTRLSLIFQT